MRLQTFGVSPAAGDMTPPGTNYDAYDPWNPATLTWAEIVAATPEDWGSFYISVRSQDRDALVMIAVGPAGSEQIVAGVLCRRGSRYQAVPIPVPAGTRIAAAMTAWTVNAIQISIGAIPSAGLTADPSFTRLDIGPLVLNQDAGVSDYLLPPPLPAPATNNAKTPWIELSETGTNSTNNILNGDALGFAYDYLGLNLWATYFSAGVVQTLFFDVAVGAAGGEVVVAENIAWRHTLKSTLMHYTGAARCDAAKLVQGNICGGRVRYKPLKTEDDGRRAFDIPVHPKHRAMMKTCPENAFTFLETRYGRNGSPKGLSNPTRTLCDRAGLPECTSHALRKAITGRFAEAGATSRNQSRNRTPDARRGHALHKGSGPS